MEPYKPPIRQKNPGMRPAALPNPGTPPPVSNPEIDTGTKGGAWIRENWSILLMTGALTAIGSVFVSHYLGGWLRRREEKARLKGEIAEAQALGREPVVVPNPQEEPELTMEDWMTSIEQRLINMAQHFGVREE